jgi:histone H3/H4
MPSTSAKQSGLTFPPGRVGRILGAGHYTRRKSNLVNVTVAAATEAMTAVLLDATAERCESAGVRTVQRDHVRDAIVRDKGLSRFFKDVCFIGVTATEYLSPAIMPSNKRRRRSKKSKNTEDAEQ